MDDELRLAISVLALVISTLSIGINLYVIRRRE